MNTVPLCRESGNAYGAGHFKRKFRVLFSPLGRLCAPVCGRGFNAPRSAAKCALSVPKVQHSAALHLVQWLGINDPRIRKTWSTEAGVASSLRVLVATLMSLLGLVYLHGSKCQECGKNWELGVRSRAPPGSSVSPEGRPAFLSPCSLTRPGPRFRAGSMAEPRVGTRSDRTTSLRSAFARPTVCALKSAPGMPGVSLRSTRVSVALQLGPSGASLSGRVKS